MNNIKFDKKLICGPDFIAVRIIDNCDEMKSGNIYLGNDYEANGRLAHCVVEDIGSEAASKTGVAKGDYVLIDRLATFAHTEPVAALKYDSVIYKTDEKCAEDFPLKNMLFVEPDEKDNVSKINNIYVQNYDDRLRTGTILKMDIDPELKVPFKVGDKVLLTKGADHVTYNGHELFIYKHDMIVATIED